MKPDSGTLPTAAEIIGPLGRLYVPKGVGSSPARPVFLAPTEDILVLTVEIPLASPRQRAQALPFAVEELIAEPLSNVHISMGAEMSPRTHITAVVSQALISSWVATVIGRGAPSCRIIPDVFAIPAPIEHGWAVLRIDGRVLVRSADGAGFAVASHLLENVWQAAGRPSILSYGAALDGPVVADQKLLLVDEIDASLRHAPIDLRQGAFRERGSKEGIWQRRAGFAIAAALVAHMVILAVDLSILRGVGEDREAQARGLLQTIVPGAHDDGDVVAALNRVMVRSNGATDAGFLPLLAKASSAIQPFGPQITLQSLAFNEIDGSLALSIEGPSLEILQAIEQALGNAGLSPNSGPATTSDGGAQIRVTIRGGSAT